MNGNSDHIAALLNLDPSYLAPLDQTGHPAYNYSLVSHEGSGVYAFPAASRRAWLETLADEIVSGRRRGGVQSQIMRRARELWIAGVPKSRALADLRQMHSVLVRLIAERRSTPEARRNG